MGHKSGGCKSFGRNHSCVQLLCSSVVGALQKVLAWFLGLEYWDDYMHIATGTLHEATFLRLVEFNFFESRYLSFMANRLLVMNINISFAIPSIRNWPIC